MCYPGINIFQNKKKPAITSYSPLRIPCASSSGASSHVVVAFVLLECLTVVIRVCRAKQYRWVVLFSPKRTLAPCAVWVYLSLARQRQRLFLDHSVTYSAPFAMSLAPLTCYCIQLIAKLITGCTNGIHATTVPQTTYLCLYVSSAPLSSSDSHFRRHPKVRNKRRLRVAKPLIIHH